MTDTWELSVTRYIDAPSATVYRVYTERLEEWWAPAPWKTQVVEMDLRAGGRFAFEMQGPEGESHPSESVYLEVIPNERIVNTAEAIKAHEAMGFEPGWNMVAAQLAALAEAEAQAKAA
jgi:uncharacterized protein YndB with AHSA1/START domain